MVLWKIKPVSKLNRFSEKSITLTFSNLFKNWLNRRQLHSEPCFCIQYVVLVQVYEENLASRRHVVGKGIGILKAFQITVDILLRYNTNIQEVVGSLKDQLQRAVWHHINGLLLVTLKATGLWHSERAFFSSIIFFTWLLSHSEINFFIYPLHSASFVFKMYLGVCFHSGMVRPTDQQTTAVQKSW